MRWAQGSSHLITTESGRQKHRVRHVLCPHSEKATTHMAERTPTQQTTSSLLVGLSEQEAHERRAHGLGNTAAPPPGRSYRQIVVENVFTFINVCLFGLGLTLAVLGRFSDALVSTAVISMNVVVSVVQEVRAKRTLDAIALLTRPTATVVRDGREREVPPEELVIGDTLAVGPGDQIVIDGRVLGVEGDPGDDVRTPVAVDESLLTGEADLVAKQPGDAVYSGSFCVTGGGCYVAEHIGANSFAQQITAEARAFRRVLTPLQQEINLVVRIVLLIVLYLEFLLIVKSVLQRINLAESVENSTIVAALVPNGLFLSIAVAYALGAVRILRFGALVQQANAIESLSHVDVLCLDKTGTLTANRLTVTGVYPLGTTTKQEVERVLSAIAASASGGNKTTEALHAAWPRPRQRLAAEIPFSSARKWSAVEFGDDGADGADGAERHDMTNTASLEGVGYAVAPLRGVYALGAPEMLHPYLRNEPHNVGKLPPSGGAVQWPAIAEQVRVLAERGLRVLLVARSASVSERLENRGDASVLPADMEPLGLVALGDELRPEAQETLSAFARAGVQLKIISGDNAETVAALARQAGIDPSNRVLSGPELDGMGQAEFDAAVASATIFGRITPQQKARLVRSLRQHGRYVAMIGDGVNDVVALKQANLGIALRSGSQATRGVADLVLMQDSFAVLAPAVAEGQRIQNGMHDILKLFLTRIGTVGLVIFSSLVIGIFPLELRQASVVTLFSVGIPAILLAVWAHPGPSPQGSLTRRLLHFVLPPMVLTSALGLLLFVGVYVLRLVEAGAFAARGGVAPLVDMPTAQTTLTAFLVCCGLLLVIFVEPPTGWWVGGNALARDWRPTFLAVGMMIAFAGMLLIPPLRSLFVLAHLGLQEYVLLVLALVVWLTCLRATWRWNLLSRYLGVDVSEIARTRARDA